MTREAKHKFARTPVPESQNAGSASRAEQPVLGTVPGSCARDDVEQAVSPSSSCTGDRLVDMMQKLRMRESEGRARVLLQDMSVLRAWQQSNGKRGASHAERNTMLKVGTRWSVQRKLRGKLRPAEDVAQDLEDHMIRAAQSISQTRRSAILETIFAMSARRAAEPQTDPTGPCVAAISDATDAKRRKVLVNTTTTKPESSKPELEFQPQRAAGSAAKPVAKRTVPETKT